METYKKIIPYIYLSFSLSLSIYLTISLSLSLSKKTYIILGGRNGPRMFPYYECIPWYGTQPPKQKKISHFGPHTKNPGTPAETKLPKMKKR